MGAVPSTLRVKALVEKSVPSGVMDKNDVQAEEALQSLRKELPCQSTGERNAQDQSKVPAAERGCGGGSVDRQQPEQAPAQGQEEPCHTIQVRSNYPAHVQHD